MDHYLAGKRLLLVEDEVLVALDLGCRIEDRGGSVVGPVGQLQNAVQAAQSEDIDGALIDVNLGGDRAYPVADALTERGVPFIFVTGYGAEHIPERFTGVEKLPKPFPDALGDRVMRAVFAPAGRA